MVSTKSTPNSQKNKNIPREDSVISFLNSYLDLNIKVIKTADNSRYANGNDISLVNLGPIALFSNFKLTTSSGKHLEDISHAHMVSLIYKLITSAKDTYDFSIRFDRDRGRIQLEITNKNYKWKLSCENNAEGYIWYLVLQNINKKVLTV